MDTFTAWDLRLSSGRAGWEILKNDLVPGEEQLAAVEECWVERRVIKELGTKKAWENTNSA